MVTIYHNPRCGKSRAALKLLEEKGIRPKVVNGAKVALGRPPENVLDIL